MMPLGQPRHREFPADERAPHRGVSQKPYHSCSGVLPGGVMGLDMRKSVWRELQENQGQLEEQDAATAGEQPQNSQKKQGGHSFKY